jgi:PAS domain S-box-containing protein
MRENGILLLKVAAVIVAAEAAVMAVLPYLSLPGGWLTNILDAVILAAIVAPIFYFWIFREVRQQADLRQAHKDLDLRFRALLDNELVGIYVIKDGRFVYVNPAFAAIFGYAQHELLALNSFLDLVCEEDRVMVQEQVRRRQEGRGRTSRYTACCLRFDGTRIRVDIMGSVLDTAEGLLVMGMLTDITERERQARDLKQSEEQQAMLFAAIEQASETVVITDPRAVILYVNPAFTRVTGYSREEAVGKTPRLLKSGRHDAAFFKELWGTIQAGQVWRGRLTNRRKDGALYLDETVISPVQDASGRIVNYVAVRHDVTAEVEREEQLRQSQKMEAIGLLAGGVAHDVNNMLTLILGYNYLLQEGLKDGNPLRPFAAEIGRAVEVGASLTRQLLSVSRRQGARRKALDLNALVIETVRMLRRIVGADVEMGTNLFPALWPVLADSGALEQVLLNFVVNARDAMPDGGKIRVETVNLTVGSDGGPDPRAPLPAGSYVMLSVRDTGAGMGEEVQERIFEPFFTTKEPGRGTGLGLSTVMGIVKEHEGRISVESAPGQGSTFRVYLPRAQGDATALMPGKAPSELRGGDETILVLEDHPELRQLAALALSEKGYRVLHAAKGLDALRLLQQYEGDIHLVLADVVLPDMACRDVLAQLRRSRPKIKTVYMSGYGGAAATQAALEPDAVLLDKPFSPEALLRAVREKLDA